MKKILSSCFVAASALLSAQIFVPAESFEGTALPTGWTSYRDAALTTTRIPGFNTSAGPACVGAKAVTVNVYGSTFNNWYLVYTAAAGTSNNTAVNFSFKYLAKAYDGTSNVSGSINFEYSVDNGVTWVSALPAPVAITAGAGGSLPCTQVTGTIPAAAFTNLASNITPKFRLYANSSAGADYYQGFDDVSITQQVNCAPPTGITAAPTGPTTATVNWTAPAAPPANGYEIYYSTSSTAPTNTTPGQVTAAAGSTSYNLTGLTPNTTHYVYVRSKCSGTDYSPYIYAGSFATPCVASNAPYINNFDNSLGDCWKVASGLSNGQPTGTSTYWTLNGFLGVGSNDSMSMNLYSTGRVGWLISPIFDLQPNTGSYKVEFDYAVTEWDATTPSAMGSDDTVELMMSTNGGSSWTSVHTFNAASNIQNTSTHFTYTIPSGTPLNNLKFAFVGNDGTVDDNEDYDFFIDNFAVNQAINLATHEVNGKAKMAEVYPNPFGEQLGIADAKNVKSVEIFDAAGRMVKSVATPGEMISTNDLKSGLYFIKVNHKDGSASSAKAIKK